MFRNKFHIVILVLVAFCFLVASSFIPSTAYVSARESGSMAYANVNQNSQATANSGSAKVGSITDQTGGELGWNPIDWFIDHVVKPVVAHACERWPKWIPEKVCEWSHH